MLDGLITEQIYNFSFRLEYAGPHTDAMYGSNEALELSESRQKQKDKISELSESRQKEKDKIVHRYYSHTNTA